MDCNTQFIMKTALKLNTLLYTWSSDITYNGVVLCTEPHSQDSRGGPDDEDQAVDEQAPIQSGEEEEDEGEEETERRQWSGPGQCTVILYF